MYTVTLRRDDDENIIKISEYGFEWYDRDGTLLKSGLVEGLDTTIEALKDEGFYIVEDNNDDTF